MHTPFKVLEVFNCINETIRLSNLLLIVIYHASLYYHKYTPIVCIHCYIKTFTIYQNIYNDVQAVY